MKKRVKILSLLALMVLISYGLGRLYFTMTAGFTLSNISSDFAFNSDWEVRPLSANEEKELDPIFNQPYHYLGKGRQSYAFESQDGLYVIKFFKYQRYRMLPWLRHFPPLPAVVQYREERLQQKWSLLNTFICSWKIAFENLKEESALLFVHLNKTQHLNKKLTLIDKIGFRHQINLDEMEFCVQRKAQLICSRILELKEAGDIEGAKDLIDRLQARFISEYERGVGDYDHTLMQNTGVVDGSPIHIDVGQFKINEELKNPELWHQELFTKNYKFMIWMRKEHPELAIYLESRLAAIIGDNYFSMEPKFHPHQ
jgi:hypothetical protein